MIKANVNVAGTVKRTATIKTNKEGKPYLSFVMSVTLTESNGKEKEIEILVLSTKSKQSDLKTYVEKKRVSVVGTMDIRKKGEELSFYLSAEELSTKDVSEFDVITGELQFRGHLKGENFYEERTDKRGKTYLVFPAYSSEKVGENYVSTWVNFMRFPKEDNETLREDWFQGKAFLDITGDLQVSAFKGRTSLSCRVKDMKLAERKNQQ